MSANPTSASSSRIRGFNIIELMIVVSIIGILAAIAIPSFQNLSYNNRRTTTVNELVAALMAAHAEAAKRGQPVIVCGTTSASLPGCANTTNWSYGWISFVQVDTTNNNYTTGDVLLTSYVNSYPSIAITSTAAAVTLNTFNQTSTAATIKLCDPRGTPEVRSANVVASGRAEVSPTNSSGQRLDYTGAALSCP